MSTRGADVRGAAVPFAPKLNAQCFRSPHQMDVHNRKGPRQNGPRLPRTDQRQIALGQRVITIVQRY